MLAAEPSDVDIEVAPTEAIVVGHDRSAGADAALEIALQLASELRAPVTIVRAWSLVTAPRPPGWTFGYVPSVDEFADAVQAELEADTRALVGRFPDVVISYRHLPRRSCPDVDQGIARCADPRGGQPRPRWIPRNGSGVGERPVRPVRTLFRAGGQAARGRLNRPSDGCTRSVAEPPTVDYEVVDTWMLYSSISVIRSFRTTYF